MDRSDDHGARLAALLADRDIRRASAIWQAACNAHKTGERVKAAEENMYLLIRERWGSMPADVTRAVERLSFDELPAEAEIGPYLRRRRQWRQLAAARAERHRYEEGVRRGNVGWANLCAERLPAARARERCAAAARRCRGVGVRPRLRSRARRTLRRATGPPGSDDPGGGDSDGEPHVDRGRRWR